MKRLIKALARHDGGAVTIELAFISPILAAMVVGISDVSIVVGRRLEVEQAAHRAIEKVMQTTGSLTVEGTIKKEVMCQINGMDAECATGRMTADQAVVTYTLECWTAGEDEPAKQESTSAATFETFTCDTAAGETEARYVTVQVNDSYDPIFPVNFGTGSDGIYQLTAEAGVRVP
jgi:Flp pilus assembly protein TadG